jgi:hypothetical protein
MWAHALDPDCVRTPAQRRRCATEHGQQCWDGFDNDRDGKVDCEDTDCQKTTGQRKRCAKMAATETGRECLDYIDNDGDGTTDCADTDCTANKKFKKRCDTWAVSLSAAAVIPLARGYCHWGSALHMLSGRPAWPCIKTRTRTPRQAKSAW